MNRWQTVVWCACAASVCVASPAFAEDEVAKAYVEVDAWLDGAFAEDDGDWNDEMPKCGIYSAKRGVLICGWADDERSRQGGDGFVNTVAIVDVRAHRVDGLHELFPVDESEIHQPDSGVKRARDTALFDRLEKLRRAGDWAPVTQHTLDATRSPGDSPDETSAELAAGGKLELKPAGNDDEDQFWYELSTADWTLPGVVSEKRWMSNQPTQVAVVGLPSGTLVLQQWEAGQSHVRHADFDVASADMTQLKAIEVECPEAAQCPDTYPQVIPILERFCAGAFDDTDVLALQSLYRAGKLDKRSLALLNNAGAALTGYAFKGEKLRAFFYGEGAGGLAATEDWLPPSCFRPPSAEPLSELDVDQAWAKARAQAVYSWAKQREEKE